MTIINVQFNDNLQQTAADAVKQLVDSKNIATEFKKRLKKLDEKTYESQIKSSDSIIKSIDKLIDEYLGKEDKRQGITRNPQVTPMQRLSTAKWYVSNSFVNGITSTETQLVKQAKEALKNSFEKTNTFFSDEWSIYKKEMKNLKLNPFKEIEIFRVE